MRPSLLLLPLAALAALTAPAGAVATSVDVADVPPYLGDGGFEPTADGVRLWAVARDANGPDDVAAAWFLLDGPSGPREVPATGASDGAAKRFDASASLAEPTRWVAVRLVERSGAAFDVPIPGQPLVADAAPSTSPASVEVAPVEAPLAAWAAALALAVSAVGFAVLAARRLAGLP
jgi:hypothetical protein